MEKLDNVIDALLRCLDGDEACHGCYLNGYSGCRDKLNLDALDHLIVYQVYLRRCGEGGELIRRSDVLKFPIRRDRCDKENANPHFINGIETVMEYMEYIPVVEAEPVVHAHWIPDEGCGSPYGVLVISSCSNCGGRVSHHGYDCQDKHCRYCGAHMDEEVAE